MKLELEEVRLRQLSKSVTPEQQGEGVRGEGVKGGGGREVKMVEGERVDNNKDLTTELRQQVCYKREKIRACYSNWCPPQLSVVQLEAAHERLRLQSRLAETEADSRSAREEASTLVREGEREGGGEISWFSCCRYNYVHTVYL